MQRITVWVLGLGVLLACGGKKETASPPQREPTAAEKLEDAGDDIYWLCDVTVKFPGTPEAAAALAKVKARHARALAELPGRAAVRAVEPKVAAFLEAIARGAAGHECDYLIGVSVTLTYSDSLGYAGNSSGEDFKGMVQRYWPWDDRMKLGQVVDLAVDELSDGWMSAVDSDGPSQRSLQFALEVVADGTIAIGDVATLPGLAIEPTLVIRLPGAPDEQVRLDPLKIDTTGSVEYTVNEDSMGLDEAREAEAGVVKQLTGRLASRVYGLPRRIGLAPLGDPALNRFAGSYKMAEVREVENNCQRGGHEVGDEVVVNPIERTVKVDWRSGRATIAGDRLVMVDGMRDDVCHKRESQRYELYWQDDKLHGSFAEREPSSEDCAVECAYRVEVVLEPQEGTLPLSQRQLEPAK